MILNNIEDVLRYGVVTLIKENKSFTGKVKHLNTYLSFSVTDINGNSYLLNSKYFPTWDKIIGEKELE